MKFVAEFQRVLVKEKSLVVQAAQKQRLELWLLPGTAVRKAGELISPWQPFWEGVNWDPFSDHPWTVHDINDFMSHLLAKLVEVVILLLKGIIIISGLLR